MKKTLIYTGSILCGALTLAGCGEEDPAGDDSGVGGASDTLGMAPATGTGGASGGEVASPATVEWAGVFALDVPEPFWIQPQGIGSDIGAFVPRFLLNISGATVTLGTAAESVQDACTPTLSVQATVVKPQFMLGPVDYLMHLSNPENLAQVNTIVRNLTITNVLPPTEAGGTLSAVLDAREIYPMFHLLGNPSPTSVCAALESFGAPCEPCPQDAQPYCLTVVADRLEAVPAPQIAMQDLPSTSLGPGCQDFIPQG